MKLSQILTTIAVLGLALIIVVTILYAAGMVSFKNYAISLFVGTVIWFGGIFTVGITQKKSREKNM